MGTADKVLDLMYRWMEKREHCAEQLRELARELEELRRKCNGSECIGNTVSAVGALSLVGAGVATFFTGGLAAPLLLAGAVYTGVGVTISLVTHLTEHLSSSATMKKAQRIESESNEIAERIKRLFEQLRKECKAESKAESKVERFNADEDELDQRVMAKTLAAISRRNGQKWTVCDSIKWSSSSGPQSSLNAPLLNLLMPAIAVGVAGILVVFAFKASGKKSKLLFAEAGKQIIKKMSTTGLKTGLKVCGKVVGGAVAVVGLAFALDEAIDSWKEMIEKNHVTEASQSLRDTADALDQMWRTLRNQLEIMMEMMAQKQREYEETEEERKVKKWLEWLEWLEWLDWLVKKWQEWLEEERKKKKKKKTPFVRAALLNVHSMNNKTSNISDLITENQLHVFFSTETWLKFITADKVLRQASPPNFRFFRHVSYCKVGRRGVAIQFSTELHGEQIHFDNNMEIFECVATVLKHDEWEEPVLSINLYRPPEKTLRTIRNFLKELQELLVSQNYKNIIVTGDFNIWVDCGWITHVKEFYRFLSGNGFNLYPWEPTYRSGHTLDLVLIRNVEVSAVKVRDDDISDHYTVYFKLRPVQRR